MAWCLPGVATRALSTPPYRLPVEHGIMSWRWCTKALISCPSSGLRMRGVSTTHTINLSNTMNIFVAKNGTRQGPHSANQLKDLVGRGEISLSDKAWYEGCAEWNRISEMPELVNVILPPLPSEQAPFSNQPRREPQESSASNSNSTPPANHRPQSATTSSLRVQSTFWPKTWLEWTVVILFGIVFLAVVVLLGMVNPVLSIVVSILLILLFAVCVFFSKSLAPYRAGEFGSRHIALGRLMLASAWVFSVALLAAYLTGALPGYSVGGGAFAVGGMFRGGSKLISKGKQGMQKHKIQ